FGNENFDVFCSGLERNGGRETIAQSISQASPKAPERTNAVRHPYWRASGTIIKGAATPPSVPPLNDNAMARARRLAGSESTAVLTPPGNVTPSPMPSKARAIAKPMNAVIHP